MRLPLKQRLKLIRQDIYAAIGFRGHKPVRIFTHPLGARVETEGRSVIVPSPLRWKLYRRGWTARLDQLQREYGVGRHISLGPESIVLDIGANAGEFAHVCARHGARVFCIEPDPAVRACLEANIAGLSNATAHDALIWKEETELEFFSVPAQADSSVFAEGAGPGAPRSATTVEAFCQNQGIERIDLLKCDAEGAEPEVLQGVGEMAKRVRCIALDTGRERRGERTNEACAELLRGYGFTVIDEAVGKRLMTFGMRAA